MFISINNKDLQHSKKHEKKRIFQLFEFQWITFFQYFNDIIRGVEKKLTYNSKINLLIRRRRIFKIDSTSVYSFILQLEPIDAKMSGFRRCDKEGPGTQSYRWWP